MRTRHASPGDIEDAITIAEIVGGCNELPCGHPQYSNQGFRCLGREHDCEHCQHGTSKRRGCEHDYEWLCVAAAIGASDSAVDLFVAVTVALDVECDYIEQDLVDDPAATREHLAWLRDIGSPVRRDWTGHWCVAATDLEAAALLRDGVLPPGWKATP